jgi:hypothetical protein
MNHEPATQALQCHSPTSQRHKPCSVTVESASFALHVGSSCATTLPAWKALALFAGGWCGKHLPVMSMIPELNNMLSQKWLVGIPQVSPAPGHALKECKEMCILVP